MKRLILAAALLPALLVAPAAEAAVWRQVTASGGTSIVTRGRATATAPGYALAKLRV